MHDAKIYILSIHQPIIHDDYTVAYLIHQYGTASVLPQPLDCQTFPGIKIFIFEIIISSTLPEHGMEYYIDSGNI